MHILPPPTINDKRNTPMYKKNDSQTNHHLRKYFKSANYYEKCLQNSSCKAKRKRPQQKKANKTYLV